MGGVCEAGEVVGGGGGGCGQGLGGGLGEGKEGEEEGCGVGVYGCWWMDVSTLFTGA